MARRPPDPGSNDLPPDGDHHSQSRPIAPGLVRLGRRIHAWIFGPSLEREVDEELEFHLEMRVREHVSRGMSPEEARRAALAAFGDIDELRSRMRDQGRRREMRKRITAWLEQLRQDVAFAVRQLSRSPGFATVAVVTLAVGIGANTAVFSVVDGVLLRPLPYQEPDRLLAVWTRYLPSTGLDIPEFPISAPEVLDYREQSEAVDVAYYYEAQRTLDDGSGDPTRVGTAYVGPRLFSLLGVRPALGRDFSAAEHDPAAGPTVVLTHDAWRERFGEDPGILGRRIELNGTSAPVVGVLPEDFVFPDRSAQLFVPLRLEEADPGGRGAHWLSAVARLRGETTLEQARAELETITAGWYREWEHHAAGHFLVLKPLRDEILGDTDSRLWLAFAAVGLVLLIACVNVANLLLTRAERRQRELALRTALGAGRGRLARQLLTESLVLAGAGAALGVVLAWWGTGAVLGIDPTAIPRAEGVALDGRVLLFAAGLATATAVLFGLVPALRADVSAPVETLAGEGRSTSGIGRLRLRRTLVAAEVALSVVVVLAAGLVVRSFRTLSAVETGVETERLLTFQLSLPSASHPSDEQVPVFYASLLERLEALPGVERASVTSALPLTEDFGRWDFLVEGRPPPGDAVPAHNASPVWVDGGYFETMEMPVLRGRGLTPADDATGPFVAVVNEAAARRYWPGSDPLGERITFQFGDDPVWLTIVGVVADARAERLDEDPRPQIYATHTQLNAHMGSVARTLTVALRTSGDPGGLLPAVRRVVGEMDPGLPLARVRTMEAVHREAVARPRLTTHLLAAFGLMALFLATVGIYGVVSYSVTRRTREIGVRVALGASRGSVVRLMLREGVWPAVPGLMVGVAAAFLLGGRVEDLLFGISATDPATFIGLPLLLLGVAALASWIPARRATRIAPSEALRVE